MTLTCECGKELKDWNGARGHVRFTDGNGHGPAQELPDGWKDLFGDPGETPGENGETGHLDDGDSTDDPSPSETADADTSESDGSRGGRLRRWLTTPVDDLLRGE